MPAVTSPIQALSDEQFLYLVCLVIGGAMFLMASNIVGVRTGRAWRAVRDGELAASAFGINVGHYKTLAFALSAALAGLAGSLYWLATAFVSTDAFSFQLSIALLVGAVVGGIGTIAGAIIGGLLTEFLPIYAQQLLLPVNKGLANAAPGAVQGVLLLVVLNVARGGVAGLLADGYRRVFEPRLSSQSRVDTSAEPPAPAKPRSSAEKPTAGTAMRPNSVHIDGLEAPLNAEDPTFRRF